MRKRSRNVDCILSGGLFCLIWHLYVSTEYVPSFLLPMPLTVFTKFFVEISSTEIWYHLFITSTETLVGFLVATAMGMAAGYIVQKNEQVRMTLLPFLICFQAAPKIALIPLFIIWFGLGYLSKIILILFMTFFPVLIGMMDGLKMVPKEISDYLVLLKATKLQKFFMVEIFYALPALFASFKVGIIQALIGAVVAEWMSGQSGLGYLQNFAASTFDTPLLMVSIMLTILIGLLFYKVIEHIQKMILFWKEGEQQ